MRLSQILIALGFINLVAPMAHAGSACQTVIKPGVYLNSAHLYLDIDTPSCNVVTIHQRPTQPNEKIETWTLRIDGSENAIPTQALAPMSPVSRALAKDFRFTSTVSNKRDQLSLNVRKQRVPLENPVTGKTIAVLSVNYTARVLKIGDMVFLDTLKLSIDSVPKFGNVGDDVTADELPVWTKGFLAGANAVVGLMAPSIHEELRLVQAK